ncbi:MAG: protein-disulfide reductase DsbD [Pseudomonadota bacterium]
MNILRRLLLLGLLSITATGWAADELVPANQAFTHAVAVDGDEIVIDWSVLPGYYLYREKIKLSIDGTGTNLGEPLMPRGEDHSDEFFGEQQIYPEDFQVRIPYSGSASEATLIIRSQGCSSEFGICFPPTTQRYPVALTAAALSSDSIVGDSPFDAALSTTSLDPDQAFAPIVTRVAADSIEIGWQIAPKHYLYKTEIQANFAAPGLRIVDVDLPAGQPKSDEYFGDTEVYYDGVFATFAIARESTEASVQTLTLRYQGCEEDGICFNPIERVFDISLPAGAGVDVAALADSGPVSEQDQLAALISSGNLLLVLGTFFAAGLVLSLTPCVLPMVPILSGIIAGDGENVTPMRGFTLALLYVLGMALTYTVAGALFAAAGQQAQTVFQQPWILATFAGLFVLLALSMFGVFNLQMPSAIQTKLATVSGNQKSGTAVGAFVMGALSSLVVTACVAPPLVAALAVIGQSGDVFRGGLALFSLSMGMGTPLLVVGASAGRLMPKVGPWMETVKQGFGFVMLGLAVWMLARLLPGEVVLLLWAILIFMAGVHLGALTPLAPQPTGGQKFGKGFGMLAMLYGALLFIGAATGGHDPLRPLEGSLLANRGGASVTEEHAELKFARIKTVGDLERAIADANQNGQAVMLDFYADWCVSCKEMEKYTFTDAGVISALDNTVLLQADVTANDDDDQALLKRFGIFGPPSIIFFGPDGVERPGFQVVGYMKADKFEPHVRAATESATATAGRTAL